MIEMKLQYFKNVCKDCQVEFKTLHLSPNAYGPVLVSTARGEISFLWPDEDVVWTEMTQMLKTVFENQWRSLSESKRAALLTNVLQITLDQSEMGQEYFLWGRTPCPKCGSINRSYSGPVDPPQFVEVVETPVTHNVWNKLSRTEKENKTSLVVNHFLQGEVP